MHEFKMPKLGADMDEGTLIDWNVAEGDRVRKGDIVAVVETAKGAIDIESFVDGTVSRIIVKPGTTVAVGTVLAEFGDVEGGDSGPAIAMTNDTASDHTPPTTPGTVSSVASSVPIAIDGELGQRVEPRAGASISPRAQRMAKEMGIDPGKVQGTGPGGSVTGDDIERVAGGKVAGHDQLERVTTLRTTDEKTDDRPIRMRRTIAAAMSRAKREIPHYYLTQQVDVTPLLAHLATWNEKVPVAERILPTLLFYKAIGIAASEYPSMNGIYLVEESQRGNSSVASVDRFQPATRVNLGVAVSLRGGGLVAPCLFDVPEKTAPALMSELKDLVRRSRSGGLRGSELSEGTLTVTHLGDRGVDSVCGVIYPPQVALVGIGSTRELPWVVESRIQVRSVATFSLSADHRVSDGHTGALFLRRIDELIQFPEQLM
jgi:pyruvate dehydrogenase E2 component (dihydrolipoamide acetyltransferase)